MTRFSLFKSLSLALGCAALLLTTHFISAAEIRVNAGTTFDLLPTAIPGVFTHTVDGIAQVSLFGNSTVHADVVVRFPANPSQPPTLNGTFTFTSADGATTLNAVVEGTGTPAPANLNQVKFTGGSGQFAAARGEAGIEGAAMFTSASTGKATWKMKGQVLGINQGKK